MISKKTLEACATKLKVVFSSFKWNDEIEAVWTEVLGEFTDKEFYNAMVKTIKTCKRTPTVADFCDLMEHQAVEYTEKKPVSVKIIDRCKVHCVSHFNVRCNNTACVRYEDLLKEQFGKQFRNEDMSNRPPEYLRLVEIMKTMK